MDKNFKIIVFVKQVPDTDDIKWTENNTIQREGLDSVMNPYDLSALQYAVEIKKYRKKNAKIIVATMGPPQAKDVLKEALALGADEAYLLSDKKFSGADTLATAYTLSQFVKTIHPDFDMIVCGQQAVDGDTAQTPSSMAQKLGIAQITSCKSIEELANEYITAIKDTRDFVSTIKAKLPVLITIDAQGTYLQPRINDYVRAQDTEISMLSASEICADTAKTGFSGSPTYVKRAYRAMKERMRTEAGENYIQLIKEEMDRAKSCEGMND